jgi:hypothetical protein
MCFASHLWTQLVAIKLEVIKLLGRVSQSQGSFSKSRVRLPNVTKDTWFFLQYQFRDFFPQSGCATTSRARVCRVTETGLLLKAARINRECTVLRFETQEHLLRLSNVFGDGITCGQRCRLPRVAIPKRIATNDIINVVRGADSAVPFVYRTERDGIDLEYDGTSDLFLTVRYTRYAYTPSNLEVCDPLLFSLIHRCNPCESIEDNSRIVSGSEFADADGCLYRVTGMDTTHIVATCFYPVCDNHLHGRSKRFDVQLAKDLIKERLNG